VQARMVSDAPLGAFLSGGIDSSLVVALMQRHSRQPVRTFTIGFDDPAYDESRHAEAVARHLGTEHHCERLRADDLLDLLPVFFEEFDEPFFDSSAFPAMAVSRLARRHVTVSLSGDGGDELFGGYHYYRIAHRLEPLFSLPRGARHALAALARAMPFHSAKLLGGALAQADTTGAFAFSRSIVKDFGGHLPEPLTARTTGLAHLFGEERRAFAPGVGAAETGMRLDACYTLADDYLQKVDLASMAFSLESRDPLLDQDLVEWAMKLPLEWKLEGRNGKRLLRRLAYRFVPRPLLDRPKQGFEVPLAGWLRGPLKAWALERIEDPAPYRAVPLERARVRALFDLHQSGARNAHPLLWAMLVLLDFGARMPSAAR
jgi:asparagine synthase (glutamine-hydrolysing)